MFTLHDHFPLSDPLSSFALLDSNTLAPPDDPDDIFGIGDGCNNGNYHDKNTIPAGTIFSWSRVKT